MLKERIITAVIAVAALLLVLFVLPQAVAQVVVAAVILLGAWEWSGFLGSQSTPLRAGYVALIAILMGLVTWSAPQIDGLLFQLALAWWVGALLWTLFYPTPIPGAVRWIAGALVLLPLYKALVVLYLASPTVLLGALLIVWAADTGAFVAGKAFGRVKLAPKISPGKTWEGVAGGLVCAAMVALLGAFWFDLPVVPAVAMGAGVAGFSILGDLTVSMLKRNVGLKDSGAIFPGHGGVLDRIDSLLAAIPLYMIGFGWISGT